MLSHIYFYCYYMIIIFIPQYRPNGLFGYLKALYDNLMLRYQDFRQWTGNMPHKTNCNRDCPSVDGIIKVLTKSVMLGVQQLLKKEKELPIVQGKSYSISSVTYCLCS